MEVKRILLAEDDVHDVELTLTALEENNLANEVAVVHTGEEALNYLQRKGPYAGMTGDAPVVVLLDLKMPKMGGLEVLAKMKSDEKLKSIPVVVVTSSRQDSDLEEAYRLGVNSYVVKPVNFANFTQAIKQIGLFWAVLNQPPRTSRRVEK